MTKREELAEQATDYVLEHGLIGLSLRPLAAELGTSDRMLIYHFGSKDELIATVMATSNERSMRIIRAMPRSATVRSAIVELWDVYTSTKLEACQRMYVEAAALGLFGREPYVGSVRESNQVWLEAITEHLRSAGANGDRAVRLAAIVDAAINGLLFDRPLDADEAEARRVVEDLADALG
jgi:AcrR family transcriptional regulator